MSKTSGKSPFIDGFSTLMNDGNTEKDNDEQQNNDDQSQISDDQINHLQTIKTETKNKKISLAPFLPLDAIVSFRQLFGLGLRTRSAHLQIFGPVRDFLSFLIVSFRFSSQSGIQRLLEMRSVCCVVSVRSILENADDRHVFSARR